MGFLRKVADKLRPLPKSPEKAVEPAASNKSSDELHLEAWTRLDRAVKNSPNAAELIKAKELVEVRIETETPDFFQRIEKEAAAYTTLAAQAEKAAAYAAMESKVRQLDKAAGKNLVRTQDIGR